MKWTWYHYLFWLATPAYSFFTMAIAVSRTKGVTATLAWLLAILAFPGLGATLYLLLANPSIKRTGRKRRAASQAVRDAIASHLGGRRSAQGHHGLSAVERSLLRMCEALTGNVACAGNEVDLLARDADAFERIEATIKAAKHSIWAEYYIINRDETGHRFLDLLAEGARRGVEVRLLFDAVGSLRVDAARLRAIKEAGGRAEAFLPFNPLRRRWAFHLRNHRKLIVVDGEIGFTGGMNMGDEYSGRARRRGQRHFRDTHLRIRGPAVEALAQTFAEDWTFATDEMLSPPVRPKPAEGANAVVAIVPSGPDQEYNAANFVYFTGIGAARERCYLTSPYFIPDDTTTLALISAAKRGVDVRLLVPSESDTILVGPAGRSYYPQLVRAGVRVFEYQPSMLHAKTMVVDGAWGVVGSANIDIRSFRLNFELGAMIFDAPFAKALEARFLEDLRHSLEVSRESVDALPFATRLGEGTARLLSPLL